MKTTNIRFFSFAALSFFVALVLNVGCNSDTEGLRTKEIPVEKSSSAVPTTIGESSPAIGDSSDVQLKTPEGTVRFYVDSLMANDKLEAEKLLSTAAAMNFRNAKVSLEAPGGQSAKYEYAAPRYATNIRDLAFVDCYVTDSVDGQAVASTLSWMVRRHGEEWKITGMVLETEPGQAPQLLSFENFEDVIFIQSNLLGE